MGHIEGRSIDSQFVALHVYDGELPISHDNQSGHGFGPFPTRRIAEKFMVLTQCECFKVIIEVRQVPPFHTLIAVDEDELKALGLGHDILDPDNDDVAPVEPHKDDLVGPSS